ncbi:hypothetical protein [Pseudomonas trivialis]|uniref:Uncharacterized protein n=1 Tax=Pseudomonas trivialis TaxID=200450 RepID=A0A0R3A1S5_9PSED|nr:hypothetical protein [Pseudomonas trivialis]KRP63294.1 hypothetical protein TU79_02670 [Pseudomonas trivialis]SDR93920.1 hypothetical protein SAMN04490205_0949 [Pseudomonas trivialis]
MPFKFKILSIEPEAYYSDFFVDKLEDQVGFDPTNTSNVAYTKYNKPYTMFQGYGGFGLKVPVSVLPIKPQAGDRWNVDIENITTGNPAAVFNYVYTVHPGTNPVSLMVVVGIPSMNTLGPGDIEINTSFTSISANTVYLFQPKQITLVTP